METIVDKNLTSFSQLIPFVTVRGPRVDTVMETIVDKNLTYFSQLISFVIAPSHKGAPRLARGPLM